jgi:hypothetical protein
MHRFNPAFGLFAILYASAAHAQGTAQNDMAGRQHLDFAGKPCLVSAGVAHPLASNPHIINHAVSLDNHCGDTIRVKVCYYRSDECTDVLVPGHGRKEQIIGVFPAMQQFRYEVKELF